MMVRSREFDETTAIDAALGVFWRRGYDGCSISDLVDATGVQRQSLYNAFEDKQGLFLRVLARYQEHVEASLVPLRDESAGVAALRQYMDGFLHMQRAQGVNGCLFVKTAFGPESADRRIRAAIERGALVVRGTFEDVLRRAETRDEIKKGTNARSCAAYLYSVLHGASALAAGGGTAAETNDVFDRAFASIGVVEKPADKSKKR